MDRTPVSSSSMAEVGYDSSTETLEVLFHGGNVYQYFNVPAIVHERLMEASSVGKFFNSEIKGRFPESRA